MKTLHIFILLILLGPAAGAQVTTPNVRALFGIDGDVKANHIAGSNFDWNDDWFADGTCCGGTYVIDTTGVSSWRNLYNIDVYYGRRTFVQKMSRPQYSVQTSRLWYDALMVRDHQM